MKRTLLSLLKKIENVLWRIRNLTAQGKITIFKTLAISKIIYLALITNAPQVIIDKLSNIQKDYI